MFTGTSLDRVHFIANVPRKLFPGDPLRVLDFNISLTDVFEANTLVFSDDVKLVKAMNVAVRDEAVFLLSLKYRMDTNLSDRPFSNLFPFDAMINHRLNESFLAPFLWWIWGKQRALIASADLFKSISLTGLPESADEFLNLILHLNHFGPRKLNIAPAEGRTKGVHIYLINGVSSLEMIARTLPTSLEIT